MLKKIQQPNEVKRAIKETVEKLNKHLRIADALDITVLIKPENTIPLSDNVASATKAVMVITYPTS